MLCSVPEPPSVAARDVECLAGWVREASGILFVTGAGISADSGLPTYRGVGGLYDGAGTEEGLAIEDALSGPMLAQRPEVCWKYIHQVEQACRGATPNAGHRVIAQIEQRHPRAVVLTQNVDGLHRAAGSEALIEMHGNVGRLHCTRCTWEQQVDDYAGLAAVPACPRCDALVRPAVVLFGEMLPTEALARYEQELAQGFSLVVMVGTTAGFPYIAAPVHMAPRWGARTVEINPGTSAISDAVDLHLVGRAAPVFDALRRALGYG
ncbi:MAG: NAD-dependent protein deacylase [Deltaproteobacteria bacterium]|nr:NAD-dependent protein deacylase [Deltaproteobacteria bacterium]